MISRSLRIGFMGTPDFAAVHLTRLLECRWGVKCVVTQPDRRKGRGLKLQPPPVKEVAVKAGLPLLQTNALRDSGIVEWVAGHRLDVLVVVAFGLMLPRSVLDLPKEGSVNVHASLLPRLRGAAPINWAIIRGESVAGVTTILMDEGMDTGDLLLQREVPIFSEETAGGLHDRLAEAGADLILETLSGLEEGTLTPIPQDHSKATYAPMLSKKDGLVPWRDAADRIANRIRGMDPWPGAFTFIGNKRLRLFGGAFDWYAHGKIPGTVLGLTERGLQVAAGTGVVLIKELQLEGRRRLPALEFLRGFPIEPGTLLGK